MYLILQTIYCDCSTVSKSPNQLPNCTEKCRIGVLPIVFYGDLCHVRAIHVPFLYRSRYTNRVSGDCYLYTGRIKQIHIPVLIFVQEMK